VCTKIFKEIYRGKREMKKALLIASVLVVAVISTACINNIAVQELNNKAAEYMQKGDYESAMNRLQASLDLDSTMYQTYYNLGVAAINANKFDKAIEALEDGIKIKPDFADFYYSLGVAQIGLADEIYEKADSQQEAAADTEKETVDIKRDITEEEKANVKELKQSAIVNLNKYLELVPDTKDRETIEEMIKQCEEFISEDNKKEA
jgi:tetratricopeptide (TPR) repeat protein